MKIVWKYLVDLQGGFETDVCGEIDIPAGAKIVHAEALGATQWYVWVEVEADNLLTPVQFVLYGTGFIIEDDVSHVATARIGNYVWHLYRREPQC